jgi:hypothetical protein
MLDGRIDTQGTVKELRAQGVLDDIAQDSMLHEKTEEKAAEESATPVEGEVDGTKIGDEAKKPRKLVKDEHRESGGVKWSIYKTYLKASYVFFVIFCVAFFQ